MPSREVTHKHTWILRLWRILSASSDLIATSCDIRSILPGLRECATDDDVAMLFITHTESFEKYLHYMVGQAQAEACVTDKALQQYFKVMDVTTHCTF